MGKTKILKETQKKEISKNSGDYRQLMNYLMFFDREKNH